MLDGPNGASMADVVAFREAFESSRAALYHPWVLAPDPETDGSLALPPSGFVAGIYARTDAEGGVQKPPANKVVRSAIGFEAELGKAQQDALHPKGINCLRNFPGRGRLVWGARTLGSDPEWKYVNVRRYFDYLERSIDLGTRWAAFEPNSETLWSNLRRAVEDFLTGQWRDGGLLGATPEEAFFARCDRSTMSQADVDAGRLVCLIGVAVLRPAEFVIFRIGQWTAGRKD